MNSVDPKEFFGIDPARIPESAWETIEHDPAGLWRRDRFWVEKPHGEFAGISIERKVNLVETTILENNRAMRDTPQRWSKGDSETIDAQIASIPLNVFYKELNPRWRDKDHIKHWLNKPENDIYRTKKGRV